MSRGLRLHGCCLLKMCEYYHVVPWYNSDEWQQVYSEIYSPNSTLTNKQEALKLLLVWKARCPSLPSGIESTLTLLEVHVQDMSSSSDLVKEQLLRLAYSSAVMRFVNHMLDTETAKGTSLYQAAKNLGVPDWIIDLRHDTAHSNNLPSIHLLREASLIGLDWLQKHYWDKYKEVIRDYRSGQKETDNSDAYKISALVSFCVSLSVCANSKTKMRNLADILDADMRESIVNDARDLFENHVDFSNLRKVSILALINIMNIHAKKILKAKGASKHVNKALLGEDSLFLSLELLDHIGGIEFNSKNGLSWQYKRCFEVLLTFLHSNDLLLEFILELIRITQCDDNEDMRCHLAAVWVSEIMKALRRTKDFIIKVNRLNCSETGTKSRKELKQLFHHWFPNEKGTGLLLDLQKPVPEELTSINYIKPIISTYNQYLTYFIKDLLNLIEPPLLKNTSEKICNLAKLISAPEKFSQTSARIYTVDDLKMANMHSSIEDEQYESDCFEVSAEMEVENIAIEKRTKSGIWQLASSNYGWATCPVGILPWQINKKSVTKMES